MRICGGAIQAWVRINKWISSMYECNIVMGLHSVHPPLGNPVQGGWSFLEILAQGGGWLFLKNQGGVEVSGGG